MVQDLYLKIIEFHKINKLKQFPSDLISSSRMTNRFNHTQQHLLVGNRDVDAVLRKILRPHPRENMFRSISKINNVCERGTIRIKKFSFTAIIS